MITLYDFIQLSMDDYYKINIFDTEKGKEVAHQIYLTDIDNSLLDRTIASWDIEYDSNELCINLE